VAQYPVITAGTTEITADLLNSMFPQSVDKNADTARNTTTVVASDPDLVTGTLTAGGVYYVKFHVRFTGLQAAGLKTAWLVPAGTTGNRDCDGPGSANAVQVDGNTTELKRATNSYATNVSYTNPRNSTSLQTYLVEQARVTIGATAGAITLQWSQATSNATDTTVKASSFVEWRRVG
jgi:hypothetical protein